MVLSASALFSILVVLHSSNASSVNVNVPEVLGIDVSSFSYNSSDLSSFETELYNTGSVPYTAVERLEVFNGTERVFTAWGDGRQMAPGSRQSFGLHWYTNSTGNFTAVVRAYFAGEVYDKSFQITKSAASAPSSIFSIGNVHTYGDRMVFDVSSREDARGVVVIPDSYPIGWEFQQSGAAEIGRGSTKTFTIPYAPSIFSERRMDIVVSSDGGRYMTRESFTMSRESGIVGLLDSIVDGIKTGTL